MNKEFHQMLAGLTKEEKIKKVKKELERHDVAYERLEHDVSLVKHEYTKKLINNHISTIINNVIYLKGILKKIENDEVV